MGWEMVVGGGGGDGEIKSEVITTIKLVKLKGK